MFKFVIENLLFGLLLEFYYLFKFIVGMLLFSFIVIVYRLELNVKRRNRRKRQVINKFIIWLRGHLQQVSNNSYIIIKIMFYAI